MQARGFPMSSLISTLPTNDLLEHTSWVEREGWREVGALSVGFRFQPMEEELIGFYLFNKVVGKDGAGMVIPEGDLYGTKNPWEIFKEFREDSTCKAFSSHNELYLFTRLKKKGVNQSRIDRRVGLGTWAGEDSAKPIPSVTQEGLPVVGSKKRYRFEKRGSEYHGSWIMIEYSLEDSLLQQISKSNRFVLCKIKKNERCAPVATRKRKQLELKDTNAPVKKRNVDKNEKEVVDLLNGRFPELVIGLDELMSFWNDNPGSVTLD